MRHRKATTQQFRMTGPRLLRRIVRIIEHGRASWRASCGSCPACNSDAPELERCLVCRGYKEPWPPARWRMTEWMRRYRELEAARAELE